MARPTSPGRRVIIWSLRIAVLMIVGWAVSGSIRGALRQLAEHDWHLRPAWLVFAGVVYAIGLAPMGWFWQRTLTALGHPTPQRLAMFAYFLGHLGKYVPGKAMSVILRVATVWHWVPSTRIALISALLETLTMMAVGAFLAATIAAIVLRLDPLVSFAAFAMAVIAVVPTLPPVARRLAAVGIRRASDETADELSSEVNSRNSPSSPDLASQLQAIDYRLLASGWIAATLCWTLLAISLWATLRAIGISDLNVVESFPRLLACVTFSVVAGFLSQLPAGLGVRDALLMQLLIPLCGEANALVAAVLMRLVWLMSELVACGILYIGARAKP